jgi:phosphate starvation-inducible PhoH-like protein
MEVLDGLNEISFNYFKSHDVVRHPVVARIVEAYERNDESERLKRIKKQEARELQATGQRPPSTKE